jgi:hypothetical protein
MFPSLLPTAQSGVTYIAPFRMAAGSVAIGCDKSCILFKITVEALIKLRVSRSSFLCRVAPGLALVALLGLSGCKDPGTASKGGMEAGGTSATPQDTSVSEIKIGHFASLTGETATFGIETDEGIKLAVKQLNEKGGVLGKMFKVETQDDQSKPEEAATVVTKFSNDPEIVAVLG